VAGAERPAVGSASDAVNDAGGTTEAQRAPPRKRWVRALQLVSIASGVGVVALVVASVLPTRVAPLVAEYPALEDRSARAPARGCTLAQATTSSGGCEDAKSATIRSEEVSFPSSIPEKGLARLKGTLTLPADRHDRRPAVIFLHGSGPNDRHEKLPGDLVTKLSPSVAVFDDLADTLAHAGFVVLRWDKRSCLRCYPDFDRTKLSRFRFEDLVADARDAIAYLETRPEVLGGAIVVAGHSEGGHLAPYVAEGDARVRAVMMLAGLTERFDVALLAQYDRFARIRLSQGDAFGAMNVAWLRSSNARCFAKLNAPHDPTDGCVGGGVTLEMLDDMFRMDERMPQVLASLQCPLFALQGSVDRNIDPLEMGKLRALLAGKDYELHYVPGVNHPLVDVTITPQPSGVSEDVQRRMLDFLSSVAIDANAAPPKKP
jgi:pimeloyl-ACP methyl ester carboxylesterase